MARSVSPEYEVNGSAETVEALEQRVRRLEQAVAALQDTQLMEDRVVERVAHRVETTGTNGVGAMAGTAGLLASATRMLLPKSSEQYPAYEVLPPDQAAPAQPRPAWFLLDVVTELRTMFRMFYDYRFRMSWTGRIVPLTAILTYVLSWLLLSNSILGLWGLLDRVVAALAIVVTYKALSREVVRYNDLLARIRYR